MNHHGAPPPPPPPPPPPHAPHHSPNGGMPHTMQHMQQMQEQFGQMRMDPHQGSPPRHGGRLPSHMQPGIVMVDPRLPVNSNGKVQTLYEGYQFTRAEDVSGPTWARVLKAPLLLSQDVLARKAKDQASGKNSVLRILNDKDMKGNKKAQVENLVAERNIEEPDDRFEWKPAYIDPKIHKVRRGNVIIRETDSMDVVLKRIPRLAQLQGRPIIQPLSGELAGLGMLGGMHAYNQGHGMQQSGMQKVHPGGYGEPIIEIAPGFSKGRPGPQYPGSPAHGPPNHGLQYPGPQSHGSPGHGPSMQGPPHQGPPHGHPPPPPPPPPPHASPHGGPHGPRHGPLHGGIEVLDDDFEPHGHHPMNIKPKKDKKEKDQHQDFGHMSGAPKGKKRPSKIELHNPKSKEKVEVWQDYDSSSDYSSGFSDNETVLTPGTSVSSEGKKYPKHREVEYPRHRRDSHRDGKRPHREHTRRSPPPPSPRLPRSSLLDEEYVIVPKKNIVRDVPLSSGLPISDGLRRLSSVREPARPPLTGHSYTYDSRDIRDHRDRYEPRRASEFGLGSLVRRGSDAQPRRMPEFDYPPEDRYRDLARERERDRDRDRERERDWNLREQKLAELRRRERSDQYFGRPDTRLPREYEATYGRSGFR